MSGFKIIGIQILSGTPKMYSKVLVVDEVYKFYDEFDFHLDSKNRVNQITPSKHELDIYSVKIGKRKININVSAIVGKNGSGKSTLLDLYYIFCLCLSKDQKEIKEFIDHLRENKNYKADFIDYVIRDLRIEVFYKLDEDVKSIRYLGSKGYKSYLFNEERKEDKNFNLHDFCYSIAINYSLYGLNETNSPWLGPMFHKNDGYQAPLVINPYRYDGNIDVNREYELANARVIQNVVNNSSQIIEIVNNQFLESVNFFFAPRSLGTLKHDGSEISVAESIRNYETITNKSIYTLFNKLSKRLLEREISTKTQNFLNKLRANGIEENIVLYQQINNESIFRSQFVEYCLIEYVLKKLFKTCLQYSWFSEYVEIIKRNGVNIITFKSEGEDQLIDQIVKDKSHITLKLRQTILAWQRRFIIDNLIWGQRNDMNDPKSFECYARADITDLIKMVGKSVKNEKIREEIDLESIPLGLLKPELIVKRNNIKLGSDVTKLSSGEQQFLFNIHTIVYHLRNLDSVFNTENKTIDLLKYKNVNIILDEIELYYHPELQRGIISALISQIKILKLKNITSINILMATHSPFVLSDIPFQNILRLEEGKPSKKKFGQTFGSNIHELLANDFFLEKGFMGVFAKEYIETLIEEIELIQAGCEEKEKFEELKLKIKIIGEPVIRNSMINLLESKFNSMLVLLKRERELEEELLNIRIKKENNGSN
jgi:predicted ATPase